MTHFFNVFIYFISLHVSSDPVLNIRRNSCINTSRGMYWNNWFSWWWAPGCSKHVEKWNKWIHWESASSWLLARIVPSCTVNKIYILKKSVTGIFYSFLLSFWSHCDPGVDSASNRNEYQKYFLGIKAADCLEIWEPETPGTLRVYLYNILSFLKPSIIVMLIQTLNVIRNV